MHVKTHEAACIYIYPCIYMIYIYIYIYIYIINTLYIYIYRWIKKNVYIQIQIVYIHSRHCTQPRLTAVGFKVPVPGVSRVRLCLGTRSGQR